MRSVVLRAGAVLLALWGCVCEAQAGDGAAKTADTSCHLYRAAHFHLIWSQYMQPQIKVLLNGKEELFGISTISTFSSIDADTASELGLKIRTLRFTGRAKYYNAFGKKIVPRMVNVKKVKIGSLPLSDMKFSVQNTTSGEENGILGLDFLHLFDVEYDPAASELSLFLHNKCSSRVVHWTNGPRSVLSWQAATQFKCVGTTCAKGGASDIVLPATLDGKGVFVRVAMGVPVSSMHMEDVRTFLSQEQVKNLAIIPGGKLPEGNMYNYPSKVLDLDGIGIRHPKIFIPAWDRNKVDHIVYKKPLLLLGDTVLNQLHFYIAYQDKKIYITAASAH